MSDPARTQELCDTAELLAKVLCGAIGDGSGKIRTDEAAYVIANLLANLSREGDGPEFEPDSKLIRCVLDQIEHMAEAVKRGAFEIYKVGRSSR